MYYHDFNFVEMKKIFLDFDGVIVDSNKFKEKAIKKSIYELFGKNEKTIEAVDFFNKNAGISRNFKLSKFFKEGDVTQILRFYSKECYKFFSKAAPALGLRQFLGAIKTKDVKIYVLSGGEKEEIIFFLKKNLLLEFFEEVLSSEKKKIDHLKEKDVSKDDIFIGDSNNDLESALKIGLKFILFRKYKSLKSFPSKKSIKNNVLLETEDFKSIVNAINL